MKMNLYLNKQTSSANKTYPKAPEDYIITGVIKPIIKTELDVALEKKLVKLIAEIIVGHTLRLAKPKENEPESDEDSSLQKAS
jgi:hypothetical protein